MVVFRKQPKGLPKGEENADPHTNTLEERHLTVFQGSATDGRATESMYLRSQRLRSRELQEAVVGMSQSIFMRAVGIRTSATKPSIGHKVELETIARGEGCRTLPWNTASYLIPGTRGKSCERDTIRRRFPSSLVTFCPLASIFPGSALVAQFKTLGTGRNLKMYQRWLGLILMGGPPC